MEAAAHISGGRSGYCSRYGRFRYLIVYIVPERRGAQLPFSCKRNRQAASFIGEFSPWRCTLFCCSMTIPRRSHTQEYGCGDRETVHTHARRSHRGRENQHPPPSFLSFSMTRVSRFLSTSRRRRTCPLSRSNAHRLYSSAALGRKASQDFTPLLPRRRLATPCRNPTPPAEQPTRPALLHPRPRKSA